MLGATLALACGLTWSMAVVMFKKAGDHVHPVVLNLYKNLLAFVLLVPTVFLIEGRLPDISRGTLALLVASGFLGIGLADAMVLKALTLIGAARIAIVECVYSPSVILLSVAFLGEQLTGWRIAGAIAVLGAVLLISVGPRPMEVLALDRKKLLLGLVWGVAGLVSMAVGIVMAKPVFAEVPLFWLIEVRMSAGVVGSLLVFGLMRDKGAMIDSLRRAPRQGLIFGACFLSTYVSMILWVSGYKYNDASVAAVLNQMSTIFTVLLAAAFLGEKLSLRILASTALAVSGVLMITLS